MFCDAAVSTCRVTTRRSPNATSKPAKARVVSSPGTPGSGREVRMDGCLKLKSRGPAHHQPSS